MWHTLLPWACLSGHPAPCQDLDVTWFRDPLPYFESYMDTPLDILFSSDMVTTANEPGDVYVDKGTVPYISVNTGRSVRAWGACVRCLLCCRMEC